MSHWTQIDAGLASDLEIAQAVKDAAADGYDASFWWADGQAYLMKRKRMKPAPRLTIQPMAPPTNLAAELACDFAQLGAIILAVGGFALLLFAFTTA